MISAKVVLLEVEVANSQVVRDLPITLLCSVLSLCCRTSGKYKEKEKKEEGKEKEGGRRVKREKKDKVTEKEKKKEVTCLYASIASLCLPRRKRDLAICLMLSELLGLRMLQT